MAKFNSGDILKILRKFGVAGDENVPRQIEELKKNTPDEFSELLASNFWETSFSLLMTAQPKMTKTTFSIC